MRDKWKRKHDEKLDKLLGMNYQTARGKLERMIILDCFHRLDKGNCFQCGFPIEDYEDMSIEHKIPWSRDTQDAKLFWDVDNIALSHKWCNFSAGAGASGKHGYVGIHDYTDKRHKNPYTYIRTQINVGGSNTKVLGYYDHPEQAAIAYDIGVLVFRQGIGKLNFEQLRKEYGEKLKEFDTSDPKFFRSRGDTPINKLVGHFYPKVQVNKDDNNKGE